MYNAPVNCRAKLGAALKSVTQLAQFDRSLCKCSYGRGFKHHTSSIFFSKVFRTHHPGVNNYDFFIKYYRPCSFVNFQIEKCLDTRLVLLTSSDAINWNKAEMAA